MKNRKSFLATIGVTGATLALGVRAEAAPSATPAAESSATPSPGPVATPSPAPSAEALAAAHAMRRFDARLGDAELAAIARGIDDNAKAANGRDARKPHLANGDEPVTSFVVPFP